jgi:adenine-specific DNA methylase
MKYMGSKRSMLQNGLGEVLTQEINNASRFFDLFAGSGSVAIHVSQMFPIQVMAFDLQRYSIVLTGAIIHRQEPLNWEPIWEKWLKHASIQFKNHIVPNIEKFTPSTIADIRTWSDNRIDLPITKAYGGHYFSPKQSVWIDVLRTNLPSWEPASTVTLAALIQASSQCAAAPGHTAQPFQPTCTAIRYIEEAWNKDIVAKVKTGFELLAGQFAQRLGQTEVADANQVAKRLQQGDLVFIDPPYSGVHYSRFYHVLETIAHGSCGTVSGSGRYPAREFRPRSKFSISTESATALSDLFESIALNDAKAVVTFPNHECSNGLSGNSVREIAAKYFRIYEHSVSSKFSTLGGTGNGHTGSVGRLARKHAQELILVLKPK